MSDVVCAEIVIAELGIKVSCAHPALAGRLRQQYGSFIRSAPAALSLSVDWQPSLSSAEWLFPAFSIKERVATFDEPHFQGKIHLGTGEGNLILRSARPLVDVEYFILVAFALLLFDTGGLMVHGAGIMRREKAFLFFGHSGSGKTTVSRLSSNDLVLNDDLVALRPQGKAWQAWGTPFSNPTQVPPHNATAPLVGLYRLVQSRDVYLKDMPASLALAELLSNIPVISVGSELAPALMERCLQLTTQVPCYQLHFLPDSSFWKVVDP